MGTGIRRAVICRSTRGYWEEWAWVACSTALR